MQATAVDLTGRCTSVQSRREMQRLNVSDPDAVNAALAPSLADLEAATITHPSM